MILCENGPNDKRFINRQLPLLPSKSWLRLTPHLPTEPTTFTFSQHNVFMCFVYYSCNEQRVFLYI